MGKNDILRQVQQCLVLENCTTYWNHSIPVDVILLDLVKAIGTVLHVLLTPKSGKTSFTALHLCCLQNYLKDKMFRIDVNRVHVSCKILTSGFSPGTI